MSKRKSKPSLPKPPGYSPKWKKRGQEWIDPKTGARWRLHPEDDLHYAHWDVHWPGGQKERVPIEPSGPVWKDEAITDDDESKKSGIPSKGA